MAESSTQSAGLDKQLLGAKNEPGKGSKRKRKRGKKPARAPSNETLESQSKNQESLACDEQNVPDNNEDSTLNTEGTTQTVSASDARGTANISKEFNPPGNEKMRKEETTEGSGNRDECINKDVQQDSEKIQEQGNEEGESKSEQSKQDHPNSKKGKFAFHRSKKVNISMRKSFAEEDKHPSDPSGEPTAVNIVSVDLNTKTAEQHVYKAGGVKLETSPSSADNENQGASKSPEGIQEKPQSKNDKGKKLKQLASFGRNKKKYEIAFELDETSNETHEENLVDTPGRFKRSRSTSSQPFQNTEIVGSESKEPVAAASSDFNNKNTSDEKDEGKEIEKKRGGKQKKKGPVLGFRRNKSQPKKKPSKSEDEQNTEGNPSKENDNVSASRSGPVEENKAGLEESNEDSKANETEAPDLTTEETSGAATEMTKEVSNKEEMKSTESKDVVPPAHEDSNRVTPKKEKKENILRRRLRKLKSPRNILQGRKTPHEDENSVDGTGDGVKTTEQADKNTSSELELTAQEKTPAAEDDNEDECFDNEVTSQAVKRKTSHMKSTTPASKKKKEDGENTIEVEGNEALSETALVIREEKDDQNIYEEVNALSDLKSFKEIKDLAGVKEQIVHEVNKEMSQQKNVMKEHEESKQSKVDEEISHASLARDDTKTEEQVSEEARRKSQKLMQTVINELTELLKKKKELNKAAEIQLQVEDREEHAKFSEKENAVSENQQSTSSLDDTGLEHELDEESYDSDVTVKRLSSHESLVEHKTEPNTEDEEIPAIAEEVSSESETSRGTEPPVENESKTDTKDEERAVAEVVPLETKTPQVTEIREVNETKLNTEDNEIGAIIEVISKETESMERNMEIAISGEVSSKAEVPLESELPVQNETKQETKDGEIESLTEEVSFETETSAANNEDSEVDTVQVPKAEARAEHKTEPGTEAEIHDINEAGETSETEPNQEDSTVEALNIKPGELVPESRAENNTKPDTEGTKLEDFTDAGESSKAKKPIGNRKSSKFKGRTVQVNALKNESEVSDDSELETITKANEPDERKEDEDVGQSKEDSCLMESNQAPSHQNSVEEWIMVHRVDLTEEISRQIKHSLVFNSLRRSYTSCCTIM